MKTHLVLSFVFALSVATARAETTTPQNAVTNTTNTAATAPVYTVKEGDTLWGIAQSNGLSCAQLCKSNGKPQDWNSIHPGQKIIVGELLDESGDTSLYAWETESDIAFNKSNDWCSRNSLFMRRRISGRPDEWRLIMTAEGDWTLADGMGEWCKDRANEARRGFQVMTARMSRDRRFVWMICNPHIGTYELVCSLELETGKFMVLTDGCTVTEQADGTLFVEGKKTYLPDENGESLGAAWYDLWITPKGKVVRETGLISKAEMEAKWAKEQKED